MKKEMGGDTRSLRKAGKVSDSNTKWATRLPHERVNDIHMSPNEEDKTSPNDFFEQFQFHDVNTGNTERYLIALGKND